MNRRSSWSALSSRAALTVLGLSALAAMSSAGCKHRVTNREHLGPGAWTAEQWEARCHGVRTSFNPDRELSDTALTVVPGDERWVDFVYWSFANKVAEHQVESYGGTGWDGPTGGVVFHWAPGSHWERDTLASFGFTLGHTIGEHRWVDTMFPDFFEKYGGAYGVNVKDRIAEIDPNSPKVWVEFLDYAGNATSPYYRYLFHQEAVVDAPARKIHLIGGQGVAFTYSFERYYHELREVLTDCRSVDFFQMYDRFGAGFASRGNWAHQNPPQESLDGAGYSDETLAGVADVSRYDPAMPLPDVPAGLPEADAMERGKDVYAHQCVMCHGARGDGHGFLAAGFDVRPRDFTGGVYKFRSTESGELPRIEDVEHIVRAGVNGSTMPAWSEFLTDAQIRDVSRYLVVFSPRFVNAWSRGKVARTIEVPPPPSDLASLVARGEEIYKANECAKCHGERGRGDGPSAAGLRDDWGFSSRPADLTYRWSFKNGQRPEDVYRTFVGGLNGTPMPSYGGAMPDERDRWALVAYVLSLSPTDRPVLHLRDYPQRSKTDDHGHAIVGAVEGKGGPG